MTNKLTTLEKKLPLRAYPEADLNRAVLMDFLPWMSSLLSLSGETSAERMEIALPALKDHCIGMGFAEIKKMFEMYADYQLDLEPIPNYFDRVLLGKIVNAYRKTKRTNPVQAPIKEPTEAEKERIMLDAIDRVKDEIQETGDLQGTAHHIYDFMISSGRMEEPGTSVKKKYFKFAQDLEKKDLEIQQAKASDYALSKAIKRKLAAYGQGTEGTKKLAKTLLIINHFKS